MITKMNKTESSPSRVKVFWRNVLKISPAYWFVPCVCGRVGGSFMLTQKLVLFYFLFNKNCGEGLSYKLSFVLS